MSSPLRSDRHPVGPGLPPRDRVPVVAGVATAAVGALNVASAMTDELPVRLRHLLSQVPAGDVRVAHALALPAGLALVGAAWPLVKRRRRALHGGLALLLAVGVLNLFKGLDIEEALVSWGLAALLWRHRDAFWVGHQRPASAALARRVAVLAAGAAAVAIAAVAIAAGHAAAPLPAAAVPGAAIRLLTVTAGPDFREPFAWLPLGLGLLGVGTAVAIAASILEPLRPANLASALERRQAAALVRRHGTDTLSAFKLRHDLQRLWSSDGRAMVAFRVEAGSMLLAGDPVGPPDAAADMLEEAIGWARRHGLGFGAVGASERFAATARAAGVHRLYLGDEALLATGPMDLRGGARKSLRKAVTAWPATGSPPSWWPRATSTRPRSPGCRRSATRGAPARRSAGSRWRTTRSSTSCCPMRSSSSAATVRATSRASCTSSRSSAAASCRWASCAASATPRTG